MGPKDKNNGSFFSVLHKTQQYQNDKKAAQFDLKSAVHFISWIVGIFFSLVPLLACHSGKFLHSSDSELVSKYSEFINNYFYDGSFLWLSITILVMSLLELLLNGIREKISERRKLFYRLFSLFAVIISAIGVYIYIDNIGNPINYSLMCVISWTAFILFALTSGIISFEILKRG